MPSDKIDKKRKRASDRHERPSKKPALELQDLPPLSASTVEDHSELAPVIGILPCFAFLTWNRGMEWTRTNKYIATTPGMNPPRNIHLQPYLKPRNSSSSTSSSTRNKGIASSEFLLQSSEHPKLDFVGREANDDADSQLKHYVAVIDPEKKTWQFVEVRKVTLRGAVRKAKAAEEEVESSEDEEMVCFCCLHWPWRES